MKGWNTSDTCEQPKWMEIAFMEEIKIRHKPRSACYPVQHLVFHFAVKTYKDQDVQYIFACFVRVWSVVVHIEGGT